MPSITSTRTTSPSSRSTAYWATLAPTLPAPTTVIFGRARRVLGTSALPVSLGAIGGPPPSLQLRHGLDDGRAELRALDLLRPVHQPRKVIGHDLPLDGRLESRDEAVGGFGPAHVVEHHLAREDHRARVDLVLAGVLRRRAVGGLEQRVAAVVVDVGPGRDADPADLGGQGVGDEIAGEV